MNTCDLEVDARGLMCPLPLLRLKKALAELEPGQIVQVLTTDPAAHLDFGVFVEQAGHQLLSSVPGQQFHTFLIRKKTA
jgi:tRNA 2-thiouridine synthesizing protein A